MKAGYLLSLLLGCSLCVSAVEINQAEKLYNDAIGMLANPECTEVVGATVLLQACEKEGYEPAIYTLLDVYEGKYQGLPTKAANAYMLAKKTSQRNVRNMEPAKMKLLQAEGFYRLALYHEKGFGCEKNEEQAYYNMEQAANIGLEKAVVERSRYLMYGIGHKKDPQRAWKFLNIVAQRTPHTPNVFYYMGVMNYNGMGGRRNYVRARKLFYEGMLHEDANCINNLGVMFEMGLGGKRDVTKALLLYRKATSLGNQDASANMQRLSYIESSRPNQTAERPATQRILNATERVIAALPISRYIRSRLRAYLIRLSPFS